ncbi:MAG: hypothetical protein GY953_28075, partial [bacterium]|nr:hypothetical protein [bacterium]
GFYPALLLLGIHHLCTPALASDVAQLSAAMGSLEEAREQLEHQGVKLAVKTISSIAYQFAERARAAQRAGALELGSEVAGRRVVISTDGGRVRIRKDKRGKKTKKGRRRYHTCWREPKLLIIYMVDESGRLDLERLRIAEGLPDHRQDVTAGIDVDTATRQLFADLPAIGVPGVDQGEQRGADKAF